MSQELTAKIKHLALEVGFSLVGISNLDIITAKKTYQNWLAHSFNGEMRYLANHLDEKFNPQKILPSVKSIISCALAYPVVKSSNFIANYAKDNDYHLVMKELLLNFTNRIKDLDENLEYRYFVDSGPVLEKPIAVNAGLGWQGKNCLVINRKFGSMFVLGEIFTNLPLIPDSSSENLCGNCSVCMNTCPTKAIVAPYVIDARKCIAYLTIENKGFIPIELRPLIGTRVFGCDECQQHCPWNKTRSDINNNYFNVRGCLNKASLLALFNWTEAEFLANTENSALRRVGYECWLRNIAIALGNSRPDPCIIAALKTRLDGTSKLLAEHVEWALNNQLKVNDYA